MNYYELIQTMTTYSSNSLLHSHINPPPYLHRLRWLLPTARASLYDENNVKMGNRRKLMSTVLVTSVALGMQGPQVPAALAENWGSRSFIRERFFEPGLSPEDAVARIRQTAEGLHELRYMLETRAWRYVMFYIRLKQAYLSQDLKNAMSTLPEYSQQSYVTAANELVENMGELDYYIRTPKIYESMVYYEKTLKSIDNLVALLA